MIIKNKIRGLHLMPRSISSTKLVVIWIFCKAMHIHSKVFVKNIAHPFEYGHLRTTTDLHNSVFVQIITWVATDSFAVQSKRITHLLLQSQNEKETNYANRSIADVICNQHTVCTIKRWRIQ